MVGKVIIKVQGSRFKVQGSRFKVQGSRNGYFEHSPIYENDASDIDHFSG
jgi:hypothetical protein